MNCEDRMQRLDAREPEAFLKSVDVLNQVFGPRYMGKLYAGWQKGSRALTVNGVAYLIWFPKLAVRGKAASSSGWINTLENAGQTIIERADEQATINDYEMDSRIRLVFAKEGKSAYYFRGVFVPDKKSCSRRFHVFKKVADTADFSGAKPEIMYDLTAEMEDSSLWQVLKEAGVDVSSVERPK